MKNPLFSRSIISIEDLSKSEIEYLLKSAQFFKQHPHTPLLQGKILASCFFEPSTRTRLSFESAMIRLGGSVIGFSDHQMSSMKKGESLKDTMRVISFNCDVIALRSPFEGAARLSSEVSSVPIINAGDGANQHPTQTLLDLFTILESQKTLDTLHIALTGDLKQGRTAHSLALALTHFDVRLYFISPENLMMPEYICDKLKKKGTIFSFHKTLNDVLPKCDILYMTRLQNERTDETLNAPYSLKLSDLKKCKPSARILHPLPRLQEIPEAIDSSDHALYFEQAKNGIFVRQAILSSLLKKDVLCKKPSPLPPSKTAPSSTTSPAGVR